MMRILVTTDGSLASRFVLPIAARLAREGGAQVTLLTVVDPGSATPMKAKQVTVVTPGGSALSGSTMQFEGVLQPVERTWAESRDQAIQRAETEGLEMLEDVSAGFEGVKPELRVVMAGDAAEAIIHEAREGAFDLVAMSTHGRTGLSEVLQGSVASAVMRSGVAPVLMVRPH